MNWSKPSSATLPIKRHTDEFRRHGDINKTRFTDVLPQPLGTLAKLTGFDGGYHRFEGTATIENIKDGSPVETVSAPAVWELMYFGKSCADETYRGDHA